MAAAPSLPAVPADQRVRPVAVRSAAVAPGVIRRRRLVVLLALVVLFTVVAVLGGRVGAQAELADPVAGHVVVQPGETLWEVAAATAPDGVDPREQVAAIQALNDVDGGHVPAWTVLLLPAR